MDFLATLKIIDPKVEGSATDEEICGSFDAPLEPDTAMQGSFLYL